MNSRKSFYDIKSFYNKKAKLKASYKGMRYQIEQEDNGEDGKKLRVYIWREPFCYEKTPDSYKISNEFSYDEDGLDQAYNWVCECYASETEKWGHAMKFPLEQAKEMGVI